MAKRTITTEVVTDDLTGEELSKDDHVSLTFSFEGDTFHLDLSKANAKTFKDFLKPYTKNPSRSARSKSATKKDLGPVRTWADENGYELNPKGRIPKAVLEAYDAAH